MALRLLVVVAVAPRDPYGAATFLFSAQVMIVFTSLKGRVPLDYACIYILKKDDN